MKRRMVIGCPGSRKTTFAEKLHKTEVCRYITLMRFGTSPIKPIFQEKSLIKE